MKKASLSDIAETLNVSKSLVSLVLNNKGDSHGISKKTQEKVKETAKKLNYTPNSMARGLRTGRTHSIGLIIADIGNPFFSRLARSMEDFAMSQNYHLVFSSSDEKEDLEIQLINLMRNRQVDGIIVSSTLVAQNCSVLNELKNANFPFVLVDRYIPKTDFSYVVSDNEKGGETITKHLLDQGRKKIALFTLTPSHLTSIRDRITGYERALNENGIAQDKNLIFEIPFENSGDVKEAMDQAINAGVDAIITINNSLASACLKECGKRDISIPKDISFASFDDVDWFEIVKPNVTSIKHPVLTMGQRAVQVLLDKIAGKEAKVTQEKLDIELVVRGSSVAK